VQLDFNQLCELLATLDRTDIAELTLKSDELELTIRKPSGSIVGTASPVDLSALTVTSPVPSPSTSTPPAPAVSDTPASSSTPPPTSEPKWVEIVSPMVGTFYRAPAPDEPPFVAVGDRIAIGQTVCIIEAMKLMNEVEAEVAGEAIEILVENGEPVEYNQPLMRILPS